MTVVQRSPNLGINIRLQPLAEAPKAVLVAKPKPPVWWGWRNEKSEPETVLTTTWDDAATPPGYFPGMWCAFVENATSVDWEVTYTPKIWFSNVWTDFKEIVAWTGSPITKKFPPVIVADSAVLFDTADVVLPDPIIIKGNELAMSGYWPEAVVGIPLVIASGNSLSVRPYNGSPTGVLVAKASVKGKVLGTVQLTIKRATSY